MLQYSLLLKKCKKLIDEKRGLTRENEKLQKENNKLKREVIDLSLLVDEKIKKKEGI